MENTLGRTLTKEKLQPPTKPTQPGDCPEYGVDYLPAFWQCFPGCPLFDECLEISQQAQVNGGSNGKK